MLRTAGYLGLASLFMVWPAMLLFAALRPEYSHSVNAVSELGALGTPNALAWNVIGFIIPGFLLAIAGAGIAASVTGKGWRSAAVWLLILSGLGFAGTGFSPAEVENGVAVVTSPSTQGHFVASLIHGIAWLIAALLLVRPMLRNPNWRGYVWVNVAFVFATLIAVFALRGVVSDAIVQRIAGATYFAWIAILSWRLIQVEAARPAANVPRAVTVINS